VWLVVALDNFLHLGTSEFAATWSGDNSHWRLTFELEHSHVSFDVFFATSLLKVSLQPGVQKDCADSKAELVNCHARIPPSIEYFASIIVTNENSCRSVPGQHSESECRCNHYQLNAKPETAKEKRN